MWIIGVNYDELFYYFNQVNFILKHWFAAMSELFYYFLINLIIISKFSENDILVSRDEILSSIYFHINGTLTSFLKTFLNNFNILH